MQPAHAPPDATRLAHVHASLAPGLLALAWPPGMPAAAQYKVVGPDGRITYTDRPPSDTARARHHRSVARRRHRAPAPQDALPQELRQAATRYPVTLYSAADCPPCDSGRQLLLQRGVPFTEKLIVSDDDAEAMERVLGARTVPSLTIGAQALRGLSPSEWNAYLDAAGYPRESKLPQELAGAGRHAAGGAQQPRAGRHRGRRLGAGAQRARAPAAPVLPPGACRHPLLGVAGAPPGRRRATHEPEATAPPTSQNSAAAPSAVPAAPKISGMAVLDAFITIERMAMASP